MGAFLWDDPDQGPVSRKTGKLFGPEGYPVY